jgi:hypothetical protein
MKKLILSMVAIATIALSSFGQAPEGFKYQAVIRDAGNTILNNQAVGMRMTIQQGSIGGTTVYQETFSPTTNAYGLVNLEIGSGTVVSGDFTTIDWANGPYFIETAADVTGGTSYAVMGTSQLMSVPYALYAKTSGNGQGPTGPQGPAGNDGAAGATGPQGPTGLTGAVGAIGLQGIQGPAGNDGSDGATGPQGPTGLTGAVGVTGLQGIQGPAGNDGAVGATGPAGPQGPAGNDGAAGATGPQGPAGANGSTGLTGPAGADGIVGVDGIDGVQGPQGIPGVGIAQTLSLTGSNLTLSDNGGTISINDADASPTNEIQNLTQVLLTSNDGGGNQIKNIQDPTDDQDVVTKTYLTSALAQMVYNFLGPVQTRLWAGETPCQILSSGVAIDSLYGKEYSGGLIFYVNQSTCSGLVISPTDNGFTSNWGCAGTLIGTTSNAIGFGNSNTTNILLACPGAGPASSCDNLVLNGYSDWFLPSIGELNLVYSNLSLNGFGALNGYGYWSSTEFNNWNSYVKYMTNGISYIEQKSNQPSHAYRAVRAF